MWTDVLIDIRNDVRFLAGAIEDMGIDLKDLYNLELNIDAETSVISSNFNLIESEVKYLAEQANDTQSKTENKNSTDDNDMIKAISKLNIAVSNLELKMDKNNELLEELIKVMKHKN